MKKQNVVKDIDVTHKTVGESIGNIISDLLYGHNGEYAERAIKELIKANDEKWRSKVLELKAILEKNKDEPVTGNVVLLELNNIFIDLGENK